MPLSAKPSRLSLSIALFSLSLMGNIAVAQDQPVTDEDSTVRYPVSFFAQYSPFSVNDMLDRIPGINVARGGGGGGNGGPGSSSGSNRRGLGLGGAQIMINGSGITGQSNEGQGQLSRMPLSKVQKIEITSGS